MYFKILSIAYGVLMILRGPVAAFLARRWARFELKAAYGEKRSFWVWLAALAGLVITALTWTMYLRTHVDYALIATLVVTVPLIRTSQVLFNYRKFREFALKVTATKPVYPVALNVAVAVLGVGLILLGIFVY